MLRAHFLQARAQRRVLTCQGHIPQRCEDAFGQIPVSSGRGVHAREDENGFEVGLFDERQKFLDERVLL